MVDDEDTNLFARATCLSPAVTFFTACELVKGVLMSRPSTRAVACALGLQAVGFACSDGAAPTYRRDVAPILLNNCASCHQPGGIAPFSLLTYDDAVAHGKGIKAATADRTMPPFNLDNSGVCQTYKDARWLDDATIATLSAWVDGGMAEGKGAPDAAKAPGPVALDRTDLVIDMGTSYTPSASAEDDYRCFLIDPKLTQDEFVIGFESHPGEPRMVHHLTLFAFDSAEDERMAEDLDAAEPGPGYTCFGNTRAPSRWLVGAGPGGGAVLFPEGTGLRMSAGRKTVLQVHYNRLNGTFPDRTTIALKLAPSVTTEAFVPRIAVVDLRLPPKLESVDQSATLEFTEPLQEPFKLWGVWPHMHNLGTQLRVTATRATTQECVAQVNRWEFHWQGFAMYTTPVSISAGDALRITCTYNTTTRDVETRWGEGTSDEMCIAFFYVTPTPPAAEPRTL